MGYSGITEREIERLIPKNLNCVICTFVIIGIVLYILNFV